jgi:hypothetical protein
VSRKKPIAFVAVSILILVIALATPSWAQRGGGGGGGGGRAGGGGPGGGAPPAGGGGGGGGGARAGGPGGPGYGAGRPVYGPGRPVYGPGYGRYPYYGYGYRYYGYPYAYGWYGYPSFYAGWGWGWPYGAYPYAYPYAAGGYAYDAGASLRLEVTPKEAEVYIDGYMVGTVDEFDGTFQRLRLAPGEHELTLYHDGFKTVHQSLRLSQGSTFKVSYKMEAVAAGEVADPRPTPPPRPPDEGEARAPVARAAAGFGTLAIRVQPADAIVLIDGERWQSSGLDRLVVAVPEGPHRIEIRKDGFETYSSDITMAQGQTVPINVSLQAGR